MRCKYGNPALLDRLLPQIHLTQSSILRLLIVVFLAGCSTSGHVPAPATTSHADVSNSSSYGETATNPDRFGSSENMTLSQLIEELKNTPRTPAKYGGPAILSGTLGGVRVDTGRGVQTIPY